MVDPKSKAGYRLGIINPLTLVGNEIRSILRERSLPVTTVALLDSTGASAGALTEVDDEPAVVAAISDEELEDLDAAFFCGPAASNQPWVSRCRELGVVAIDLSQDALAKEGKLVVAGINLDEIGLEDTILVSPHPAAIPLALILHQLNSVSTIELVTATVVQPASELGQAAVEELAQQTIAVLNVKSVPQEVFDRQVAFNLFPAAVGREDVVVDQVRSLVATRAKMAILMTQGTIFHSHTFSLFVKTKDELEEKKIVGALRANSAIAFAEGDQQFGTIDAAGRDEVLIGLIRVEPAVPGGFWVWAVCDNLRRSTALNAVLIAEKVLFGTGAKPN